MKRNLIILALFIYSFGFGQNYKTLIYNNSNNLSYLNSNKLTYARRIPLYNLDAIAYFEREYEVHEPDKQVISDIFDSLKAANLYDGLHVFYSFKTYSDSGNMHSWVSDNNVITFIDLRHKPNFFRYSGIEGLDNNIAADILFGNTNFNPTTEGVDADSLTVGIWLDDYFVSDGTQFGAYDAPYRLHSQIGRGNDISFSFINGSSTVAAAGATKLTGLFNYSRKSDSVIIHQGSNRITNVLNTFGGNIDEPLYIAARNDNSTTANGGNESTVSFFYISEFLTDLEVAKMNSILEYFSSQLIRQDLVYENDFVEYKYSRGAGINNLPVIWQKDSQVLAAQNDTIYMSLDGGVTYSYQGYLAGTELISAACMFSNNNVLIMTEDNDIYNSLDSLQSFNTLTLYNQDSTIYTIHTPASATYPGNYFDILQSVVVEAQSGQEIAFWGGYVNNVSGAAPVNCYYSADSGKSVRVAYEFGQNPNHRDDGTANGGITGTLLGDASNSIITEHVHHAGYSSTQQKWYFCTGDTDTTSRWFEGDYNSTTDKWSFDTIINAVAKLAGRFKSTGINIIGDTAYFGSDDNLGTNDFGVFKTHVDDIGIPGNHIALHQLAGTTWNLIYDGNNFIQIVGTAGIRVSLDNGQTWSDLFKLDEFAYDVRQIRGQLNRADGFYAFSDIGASLNNRKFGGTILIKFK